MIPLWWFWDAPAAAPAPPHVLGPLVTLAVGVFTPGAAAVQLFVSGAAAARAVPAQGAGAEELLG